MGQSTTIGTSIKIKGELSGEEDLVIQGNVEGTILLQENSVSVGEHGKIQADVYAKNITIQGELSGDLHGAEKVTVTRSGKVRGNIIAPRVVLEDGASFKGSIDMDSKPAVPARIPDTANTPAKAKNA
ncbi:MAG TPA: polymer-forming cytoskeletal protein [Gammaproteobacteria bacterium]|nr:polymer-forming cytoskeletal protein [Gammaproteobacteria bacterium]